MTDHREAVLTFLAEHQGEEFSGADLTQRLRVWSGPLYVALIQLERDGLIESRWEENVPYPRRRFYRISAAGLGHTWAQNAIAKAAAEHKAEAHTGKP